jgi:hypothetical protein
MLSTRCRVRLVEQLNEEAVTDRVLSSELEAPPGSMLELRDGFYVFTGSLSEPAVDHRADREERVDQLIVRLNASRD